MDGLGTFFSKLDKLTDIDKEVFRAVDECGQFVRDDARLRVPVDTSDLRKSIDHTTEIQSGEVISTIHTNSDHAAYVEFGTGPVGAANHAGISPEISVSYRQDKWLGKIPGLVSDTDSGLRYIAGQPAQPYLYPALKENEDQIETKLQNDIARILEEKSR